MRLAALGAALGLLAGCSPSTTATAAHPTPSAPATLSKVLSPGSSPASSGGSVLPSLAASTTTGSRHPVRVQGVTDSALKPDDPGQIGIVYDAFLSDFSGLLDYLSRDWMTAVTQISTERMSAAAVAAAGAVQQAHDHGIGALVDSHRRLTVTGGSASLTDCLNEKDWYVVEDKSGRPDPSVTRGMFIGTATFTKLNGQWKVSAWNSHPHRCSF